MRAGRHPQNSSISGSVVVRSQTFDDGVTENATIDIRSGRIIDIEREQGIRNARPPGPSNPAPRVYRTEPIDLEGLKRNR